MIITNLTKQIGELHVFIKELKLEPGKVHGLFGSNGCGKSTLAKMLISAMSCDSGFIDYEGLTKQDITLMPQRPYLLQRSVYDNIIYPLQIRNMKIDEAEIDNYLNLTRLINKKYQYARILSSGEQQKISFIRSIIFKPKFVIIDETLSNLDIDSLKLFINLILELQNINKITWLIISHQLNHLEKLCEKVHYMQKGEIIASGTLKSVLNAVDCIEAPYYI